jgi:O-antigen/teichoic acid export membrane protein
MTPLDRSQAPGQARPGGVRRTTAFALTAQITTAAFTAALTLYLVRALGPSAYGVFALAVSIGSLVGLPSDFGVSSSAARFIAERRRRPTAVGGILAEALRLKLLTTSVACTLLAAGAAPIAAAFGTPELTWPLRAVAVATLGQSLMALYGAAFIALGRLPRYLQLVAGESAAEASASVALVILVGGASAAALGRAIGYVSGATIGFVLCQRLFGWEIVRLRARGNADRRSLALYAGALFVVDASFTLLTQVDVLLVGALLGASTAGIYQAPLRLVTVLQYPGLAASNSIAPRTAAGDGLTPDAAAFRIALRWLAILQGALIAPIVVWADPIVHLLLGGRFGASAAVLRALAPFVFLSAFAPLVSTTANYLGRARRRIPIVVLSTTVSVAACLLLIPAVGVVGGALATDSAYAVYVPAHLWISARVLGVPLRPILSTLGRSVGGSAAMAIPLAAAGTASLAPLEWAWAVPAGVLAYAGALFLTGEFSRDELASARRFARARLHLRGFSRDR